MEEPKKTFDEGELSKLLAEVPTAEFRGTWPYDSGYVDYETLSRVGDLLRGRFALTFHEVCKDSTGYTTMPNEKYWQTPIQPQQCDTGKLVLHAVLKKHMFVGSAHISHNKAPLEAAQADVNSKVYSWDPWNTGQGVIFSNMRVTLIHVTEHRGRHSISVRLSFHQYNKSENNKGDHEATLSLSLLGESSNILAGVFGGNNIVRDSLGIKEIIYLVRPRYATIFGT